MSETASEAPPVPPVHELVMQAAADAQQKFADPTRFRTITDFQNAVRSVQRKAELLIVITQEYPRD